MTPTFPAKTFPQHYTIVTGLHPSHHGIVANTFTDRTDGARFVAWDSLVVRQSRWWGGEPIWVTAERQGVRAFTLMWPGSEATIGGVRPSRWKPYDRAFADTARVDSVLAWLALPPASRPRFLTLYFEEPDWTSHEAGLAARATDSVLARLDMLLGRLTRGIERLGGGLADAVNLVVVSDHGMAGTALGRIVLLSDLVDTAQVAVQELGPLILLDPRPGVNADSLLARLRRRPHLNVYRDSATPAAWRYPAGPRVPRIVGVPDEGWLLVLDSAALRRRQRRPVGGEHGYDPAAPAMRALFVAAGPAFRQGLVAEPFTNIHVYELLCRILGIRPAPNDGSLDSVRAVLRD
jgi:predicted AlkP superfamily pyrophosphatase or phosphodiesterase